MRIDMDIDTEDINYINNLYDGPFLIRFIIQVIVFAILGAIMLIFSNPTERSWVWFGGMFLFFMVGEWLQSEFYLVRRDIVATHKAIRRIEAEMSALRDEK